MCKHKFGTQSSRGQLTLNYLPNGYCTSMQCAPPRTPHPPAHPLGQDRIRQASCICNGAEEIRKSYEIDESFPACILQHQATHSIPPSSMNLFLLGFQHTIFGHRDNRTPKTPSTRFIFCQKMLFQNRQFDTLFK